jgi:hypothetical protein
VLTLTAFNEVPVPEWHLRILEKREAELVESPEEGSTWEEVLGRLQKNSPQ